MQPDELPPDVLLRRTDDALKRLDEAAHKAEKAIDRLRKAEAGPLESFAGSDPRPDDHHPNAAGEGAGEA
jgi:hypothetical protein